VEEPDKAWAAGIVEGEGFIRIGNPGPDKKSSLYVAVVNCDRQMLEHLQDRWGGRIGAVAVTGNRKPAYRWGLSARQAVPFLEDIWPYIVTDRIRAKVELALEFQRQKHKPTAAERDAYVERQNSYYLRMKALNVRGKVGLAHTAQGVVKSI
jgi:hypothetical protein